MSFTVRRRCATLPKISHPITPTWKNWSKTCSSRSAKPTAWGWPHGKNIRLFVVDCTPWGEDHPELADYRRAFINAEIYERSEETSLFNEGCLSLPGLHEDVRRPVSIRMRYVDEKFVEHDEEFTGLPARVIQHEYDHIEGKVFTDRLSPLRRNLLKSKLQRLAGGKYRCSYKTK